MKAADIPYFRMANQHLVREHLKSVKELVAWMGALQAQDPNMVKWAAGIRLSKTKQSDVDTAINNGDIIRTHVLRPTWHYVAPEDLRWMLQLTAPRIKAQMKGRLKELEITPAVLKKTFSIIEKTLAKEGAVPRQDLVKKLQVSRISVDENRSAHLFMAAELEGLICSGPIKNKASTFALLEDRLPKQSSITNEDALHRMAVKYFQSHGPATLGDFGWWSGLSLTECRKAIAEAGEALAILTARNETYWVHTDFSPPRKTNAVLLLPPFDEFLISYKDRSAIIEVERQRQAISINGIFRPVVLVNGRAVGLWARKFEKGRINISYDLFIPATQKLLKDIKRAALAYGKFMEMKAELQIPF